MSTFWDGLKSDSGVSVDDSKRSLRWGVEQRLQFIEFRLFWEGYVNRSNLIDKFGAPPNQVSGDLNRCIALVPDNMVYDKNGEYRDFVISRILKTHQTRAAKKQTVLDTAWDEFVELEFEPHPDLSPNQRRVIELDYGMQNGSATILVRAALLYYALKRLGFNTEPSARKPQDHQIVLLNRVSIAA